MVADNINHTGAALQMNPEFTLAATRARQARLAADVVQGTR